MLLTLAFNLTACKEDEQLNKVVKQLEQEEKQDDLAKTEDSSAVNQETPSENNETQAATTNEDQQSDSNTGTSEQKQSVTPKANEQVSPSQNQTSVPSTTKTCYLTIECKTILNNMANLTPGKEQFVPQDGYILKKSAVTFNEGESVFDLLLRETKNRGIHMEYEWTPIYGSNYIEGINQLYEFDCGAGSGWMYYVNGIKLNYGVSKCILQEGDNVEFRYTCDLGNDLANER